MTKKEIQSTLKQFNTFIHIWTKENQYVSFYYCIDTYKMTLRGVDTPVRLNNIVNTLGTAKKIEIRQGNEVIKTIEL